MVVLTLEDFVDHIGSPFAWRNGDDSRDFVLEEATPLPAKYGMPGMRPPFRLMFRIAGEEVFPQGLYTLDHPARGEVTIFLVPESKDEAGVRYCASFA